MALGIGMGVAAGGLGCTGPGPLGWRLTTGVGAGAVALGGEATGVGFGAGATGGTTAGGAGDGALATSGICPGPGVARPDLDGCGGWNRFGIAMIEDWWEPFGGTIGGIAA